MPDIYDTHPTLYKLVAAADVPEDAWEARKGWTTCYAKMDTAKYFKLQFGEQLKDLAASSEYSGNAAVKLLVLNVETMCEEADIKVVIEDGEPRAYCDFIPYACLSAPPRVIELNKDGKHVLPLFGADLAAYNLALQESAIDSENSSDDDGLEPFSQHMYDLDDDGNDALDPS
jgi:hypothetical protein